MRSVGLGLMWGAALWALAFESVNRMVIMFLVLGLVMVLAGSRRSTRG